MNDSEMDTEMIVPPPPPVDTKFRVTVEPIIMFLFLGLNIYVLVQTNIYEERVCLHSEVGQNKSVNCFNMTAAEQEKIQPAVADLLMVQILIEKLVPCVTNLFLGPWSDVNGRLPLLVSAIFGMVISNCMFCVFSTIPDLPPVTFILCSLPIAISGGTGALFTASYCYIVDITDLKTRAFRLGILQLFISLGSITGSLLSPLLYSQSSTFALVMSTIFITVGLLYTCIFLKETVIIKEGVSTKLFNLSLVKDMWFTIVKKRYGFLRCIIFLSAVLLTLNYVITMGEEPFIYMYLQKQYSWSLEKYSLLFAYSKLLSAIIPAISLYILCTKLQIPDIYLATAVTGLRVIEKVGFAYSVHTWQFYIAKIFGSFAITYQPFMRSQLSKCFPPEDLGKIYTFVSVVEDVGYLFGSSIYTTVYNMTIHSFSNCVFLLSSVLSTFLLTLSIIMILLLSKSVKSN